jgi:hypothetical protein
MEPRSLTAEFLLLAFNDASGKPLIDSTKLKAAVAGAEIAHDRKPRDAVGRIGGASAWKNRAGNFKGSADLPRATRARGLRGGR